MTPIQEATKEWFEMEGWKTHEEYPFCSIDITYKNPVTGMHENELPVIDANYFFSEVVGKMRGLGLRIDITVWQDGFYDVTFIDIDQALAKCTKKSIIEAGLKAAIAARKELGK